MKPRVSLTSASGGVNATPAARRSRRWCWRDVSVRRPTGSGLTSWLGWLKRLAVMLLVLAMKLAVEHLPPAADKLLRRFLIGLLKVVAPGLDRRITSNLALAYADELTPAERRQLADRVWESWGRSALEFFRLDAYTGQDLLRRVRVHGAHFVTREVEAGRGVLMLTAHYGNFELMAAVGSTIIGGVAVMARRREDSLSDDLIASLRRCHGIETIHRSGWRELLRRLRRGQVIGVLMDQRVKVGGIMAEFMDRPASTAVGPLLLARHTNAAIVPCFIERDADGRATVHIHRPLAIEWTDDEDADLLAAAAAVNAVYSAQIRRRPEDWHWFHRRWQPPVAVRHSAPKLRASLAEAPEPEPVAAAAAAV